MHQLLSIYYYQLNKQCEFENNTVFKQMKAVTNLQAHINTKYQICGYTQNKRQRCITITTCSTTGKELQYRSCTVIENRAENVTGTVRSLVLSVDDNVNILQGRKVQNLQESQRWIDKYKLPGQYVFVKQDNNGDESNNKVSPIRFPISSSPYAVRTESAYLAASIIEILVENGTKEFENFVGLGPGNVLQVSEPQGSGFSSLFNDHHGLLTAMEEGLPLLMIGQNVRGMAALRSALEWTSVQAHAGNNKVTLMFLTPSRQDAPYIKDWDKWRDAGIVVHPLFGQNHEGAKLIEEALVHGVEGNFTEVVGGRPNQIAVLMAGLDQKILSYLSTLLKNVGVEQKRIMLCEFF
eukprot:TRINITY_DN2385_c0_g2_i1.p1 TRINITY_DN2385_c0_g2~~TRINITY_DN2385_c0_g2_i1.p1  ORF type:complete len:379 (-),score=22.53 TRINITY_DN2385_c0_g2_i1:182-1234(-)